ncbi:hypothetical protein THF1C08_200053 [Vibrio jasicida]|uniref:DUF7683 domain-containing protein n=3 Tax=Vibrionaceae TaxID=641 RepID=A0AAU9QNT2_9VIBR|nr:hypothetical protein THF1C08_200053 [Vibrio jasicida]CAH1589571.1 hypothetical protein THF1A12_210060 [Vibrio jasicida]
MKIVIEKFDKQTELLVSELAIEKEHLDVIAQVLGLKEDDIQFLTSGAGGFDISGAQALDIEKLINKYFYDPEYDYQLGTAGTSAPMNLSQIVLDNRHLDPDLTIYIDSAWSPDSRVLLCAEPEDGSSPEGYDYFLEVFILQELFENVPEITVERVIKYAQVDA